MYRKLQLQSGTLRNLFTWVVMVKNRQYLLSYLNILDQNKFDWNTLNTAGITALGTAIVQNNISAVLFLLDKSDFTVVLMPKDKTAGTVLHLACEEASEAVFQMVLKKCLSDYPQLIGQVNKAGYSPLALCCFRTTSLTKNQQLHMIDSLLGAKADVNQVMKKEKMTILHYIILLKLNVLNLLLERPEINIRLPNERGQLPLHLLLIESEKYDKDNLKLKALLNTYAKRRLQVQKNLNSFFDEKLDEKIPSLGENNKTVAEMTPLGVAITSGKKNLNDVVKMLIEARANPNTPSTLLYNNSAGAIISIIQTPLHLVVMHGNLETVQFLIEAKANVTANNGNNETAFDVAQTQPKTEIAEYLKRQYLSFWRPTSSGSNEETPKLAAPQSETVSPSVMLTTPSISNG